jgi:hypothetical protein
VATGSPIDTGSVGAKNFSVTGTDVAGNPTVATNNYTVAAAGPNVLLEDNFDRANDPVVGENWVEAEQAGATVSIGSDQLFFDATSNTNDRPVVSRTFTPVSTGTLHWDFDFNWTKIGADPDSEVWMQLGDSTQMLDTLVNPHAGVGVNLRWGANGLFPQRLVARQNGGGPGVQPLVDLLSGTRQVSVNVDLATGTYSVAIDGTQVGTGLAFDDSANVTTLDTVRFLTNNMLAASFSGRTFDNVIISGGSGGPGDTTAPVVTITTPADGASFSLNQVVLADFSCTDEAGGSGIASCVGDVATGSPIDTGSVGAKNFSVTGTDVAGNPTVATNNYTVAAAGPTVLLEDNFDRPASGLVGENWVEAEQAGATVSIGSDQLFFDATSNTNDRPVVSRTFTPVSTGTLFWEFDLNWTKIGADTDYELWMQLGDSTQMLDTLSNPNTGVGVDLRWGNNGGFQQRLVARQNGGGAGVQPLDDAFSGTRHLTVTVDLATGTYSLNIDGAVVGSNLAFDDSANVTTLDTVRFLTNNMLVTSFSGRTFDNVVVSAE